MKNLAIKILGLKPNSFYLTDSAGIPWRTAVKVDGKLTYGLASKENWERERRKILEKEWP